MIGGIGNCGRELCCASFLQDFDPVSIKMAKNQNLPLNPNKISGICGRLLCCLTYENETYVELAQDVPVVGKPCCTPTGDGKIVRQDILRQTSTVAFPDDTQLEFKNSELDQCRLGEKIELSPDKKDK
jgi:cell fate regulator YaaT (PSP1 superfamily)